MAMPFIDLAAMAICRSDSPNERQARAGALPCRRRAQGPRVRYRACPGGPSYKRLGLLPCYAQRLPAVVATVWASVAVDRQPALVKSRAGCSLHVMLGRIAPFAKGWCGHPPRAAGADLLVIAGAVNPKRPLNLPLVLLGGQATLGSGLVVPIPNRLLPSVVAHQRRPESSAGS
jgi:hypothetical protein